MRKLHGGLFAALMAAIFAIAGTSAQTTAPYKLGMFEQNGRAFVGLVIQNDTQVIDLSRANLNAPATLKQLISGWDTAMGNRLAALAAKPSGAIAITQVKTLPPVADPSVPTATVESIGARAFQTDEHSSRVGPRPQDARPGWRRWG